MSIIEHEELEGEATQSANRPKLILSQKDYTPSPYQTGAWEIVGETGARQEFASLEVSVMDEGRQVDPLFADFGGSTTDGRGHYQIPGEAILSDPLASVPEEILEAVKSQAFQAGHEAGVSEGAAAAEAVAKQELAAVSERIREISQNVQKAMEKHFAAMEQEALRLALEVAKRILVTTAHVKPEYIVDVLHQAIATLGVNKPLRIRVSPDDLEFIQVIGLPADLSREELGVEYVADESVKAGCVVESAFGELDLELERMWEQVRESIYLVAK